MVPKPKKKDWDTRLLELKVSIIIGATFLAIVFMTLVQLYPSFAVYFLTAEVVLLPVIYQVGNMVSEKMIEDRWREKQAENEDDLYDLDERFTRLSSKYDKLKNEHEKLKWRGRYGQKKAK